MKRLIIFLIILTCLVPSVWARNTYDDYNQQHWLRCTNGLFRNNITVSQTNTTITFTRDAKAIYVKNTGATNEMYVDPRDGVAVATDNDGGIKIEASKDFELSSFQARTIGLIASSGESTTAQVIACW